MVKTKNPKTKKFKPKSKFIGLSKHTILLAVAIIALIGGAYSVYKSFAYTDSKGRLWATYGIQVRQMHSTGLVGGATVTVAGYYDDGSPAGETCNDSHSVTNISWPARVKTTDASGYAYFTCITRNASSQRISYRLAGLSRADYAATTDGPSSSPNVCGLAPCINVGSTVLNPASSGTSNYATYMYARPGAPTITSADKAQTSLTLRWNPGAGAHFYQTYLNGKVYGTTSNSYQKISGIGGLKCNTAYSLGVQSFTAGLGSSVVSKSFTTAACPAVAVTAKPSSTSSNSSSSSSPSSPSKPTAKRNVPSTAVASTQAQAQAPDTESPIAPTELKAVSNSGIVELSWQPSTDNVAVVGYTIERFKDGSDWQMLSDKATSAYFSDSTAEFNANYTYRVSAYDGAGNPSEYAFTDISTSDFSANATSNSETSIESPDGKAIVKLTVGALSEDALCSILPVTEINNALPENGSLAAGPYKIECKKKDGTIIDSFGAQVEVTIKSEKIEGAKVYVDNGGTWEEVESNYDEEVQGYRFSTDKASGFALVTPEKGSFPALLIFGITTLILAILCFIGWLIWRRRLMASQAAGYDLDYFSNNTPPSPPQAPPAPPAAY